jgi:hypothetical protein
LGAFYISFSLQRSNALALISPVAVKTELAAPAPLAKEQWRAFAPLSFTVGEIQQWRSLFAPVARQ